MKVLFVFSCPETFAMEYVKALKKFCSVFSVFIDFDRDFTAESSLADYVLQIEEKFAGGFSEANLFVKASFVRKKISLLMQVFNPDVIHCFDSRSFLPFRFDRNVFYSCHLGNKNLTMKFTLKLEMLAVSKSAICSFNSLEVLLVAASVAKNSNCVLINPTDARNRAQIHLCYYTFISQKRLFNIAAAYKKEFYALSRICDNEKFTMHKNLECQAVKKLLCLLKQKNEKQKILVLTWFSHAELTGEQNVDCISIRFPSANGIHYRSECLPFPENFYDTAVFSAFFPTGFDENFTFSELARVSKTQFFVIDKKGKIFAKPLEKSEKEGSVQNKKLLLETREHN